MGGTGFFTILLACVAYGVIHSLLASTQVKALAARLVGQAAYHRFYRLFFVVAAFATTLPMLALVALLPDRRIYAVPFPWVILTLLVQAAAVLALLIGLMQTGVMRFLGIQQLLTPSGLSPMPEKLIVGGLYRWARHPLYAASFLLLWLAPVMTWNILALDLGWSAYMLIGSIFEEHKLVQQFGKEYVEYRRRTPRVVPGARVK